MNLYGYVLNNPVLFFDALGMCPLSIIHVPTEGPWPPEYKEGDIARFSGVSPTMSWEAYDCSAPNVGEKAVVSPCSATIWVGGSFDPPTHEMNHYGCLQSYERELKSTAIDLGCVCEKDACYLARKNLVAKRVAVASTQYLICILTDDCADNGDGNLSNPYCQDLVGRQASLISKQQALQSAMQAVMAACQE